MTHEQTVWEIVKRAAILEVTVKELAAALREAETAAYEKAARAAESQEEVPDDPAQVAEVNGYNRACQEIAAAIRALGGEE